jgi:hypothetical protein
MPIYHRVTKMKKKKKKIPLELCYEMVAKGLTTQRCRVRNSGTGLEYFCKQIDQKRSFSLQTSGNTGKGEKAISEYL